jgi:hypothetical protein
MELQVRSESASRHTSSACHYACSCQWRIRRLLVFPRVQRFHNGQSRGATTQAVAVHRWIPLRRSALVRAETLRLHEWQIVLGFERILRALPIGPATRGEIGATLREVRIARD